MGRLFKVATLLLPLLLTTALVESFDLEAFFPDIFGHHDDAQPGEPKLGNHLPVGKIYKKPFYRAESGGKWEMFKQNAGVSAMHLVVNHENKAIFFDSTIYNPSQLRLTAACRKIPGALNGEEDCWAHAAEMDIYSGAVRPLKVRGYRQTFILAKRTVSRLWLLPCRS